MNLNALETLARQVLAREPRFATGGARAMQYPLTRAEAHALRSQRWQTAAPLRRSEGAPPVDVFTDKPDMGGWF
jgi:hypothetical protein